MDILGISLLVSILGNIAVAVLAVREALSRAHEARHMAELEARNNMLQGMVEQLQGMKANADQAALEALRLMQANDTENERARLLLGGAKGK